MAKRKFAGMGDDATIDVVLLAGAGIAAYLIIVKPLLNLFGGDSASIATIDTQKALPPAQNPFNYQFQPFVDFFNNNTPMVTNSDYSWYSVLPGFSSGAGTTILNPTLQQYFTGLKRSLPSASPWALLDVVQLSQIAEQLNTAVNGFTLTVTDQTAALSPLAALGNQMQLAFIANYFWWNFNLDLLTDLQGSLFKQGLSPDNLAMVINQVNSLPVNPTI